MNMKTAGQWVWVLAVGVLLACWLAPTAAKMSRVVKARQGGSITGKAVWGGKPLPADLVLTVHLTEKHGVPDKSEIFHAAIGKQGVFIVSHIRPGAYSVSLSLTASAAALEAHGFGGAYLRGDLRKVVVVRAGMKIDVGTIKLLAVAIH